MAGYYQFSIGSIRNSDIAVQYSTDGQNWADYNEPGWPPNPQNRGNVLTVNSNDTVYIYLNGPSGWSVSGAVQVIIARANSAPSGQAYTPFGGATSVSLTGQMNGVVWQGSLGQIVLNPGPGNKNKFEITVAFNATLPGVNGPAYFSEDPELDVEGM